MERTTKIEVRVSPEEKSRYEQLAKSHKRSVSNLIRALLDQLPSGTPAQAPMPVKMAPAAPIRPSSAVRTPNTYVDEPHEVVDTSSADLEEEMDEWDWQQVKVWALKNGLRGIWRTADHDHWLALYRQRQQ